MAELNMHEVVDEEIRHGVSIRCEDRLKGLILRIDLYRDVFDDIYGQGFGPGLAFGAIPGVANDFPDELPEGRITVEGLRALMSESDVRKTLVEGPVGVHNRKSIVAVYRADGILLEVWKGSDRVVAYRSIFMRDIVEVYNSIR